MLVSVHTDTREEEISRDQSPRICSEAQTRRSILAEQLTRPDVPLQHASRTVTGGFWRCRAPTIHSTQPVLPCQPGCRPLRPTWASSRGMAAFLLSTRSRKQTACHRIEIARLRFQPTGIRLSSAQSRRAGYRNIRPEFSMKSARTVRFGEPDRAQSSRSGIEKSKPRAVGMLSSRRLSILSLRHVPSVLHLLRVKHCRDAREGSVHQPLTIRTNLHIDFQPATR